MNSMIFTKTPLKKKKPVIYGTNNMGKYYNNEKVTIKNFTSTSIAERIDKNMSNLLVPTNLTDKNLTKFINPILNIEDTNLDNSIIIDTISVNEILALTNQTVSNTIKMNLTNRSTSDCSLAEADNNSTNPDFNSDSFDNISTNEILALTNPTVTNTIKMSLTNKNLNTVFEETKLDVQMNIETDKSLNTFVNNVYTTETLTITKPLPPNVVKMNIEIDKKYFNSFINTLNIHEITNDFDTNFYQEEEIFKKINSKKSLVDEILQKLRLTKLTIENVYQEKYGNINASGIGDFLRGSYFLMQFCEQLNFSYNINMSKHPISQFLEIYQDEEPLIAHPVVDEEEPLICPPVVDEEEPLICPPVVDEEEPLICPPVVDEEEPLIAPLFKEEPLFTPPVKEEHLNYPNVTVFRTTNFKPLLLEDSILSNIYNYKINICLLYFLYFHIFKVRAKSVVIDDQQNYDKKIYAYIITYPNTPIKEKHKLYMQQLLKPTSKFLSIINNTLDELGLVQKEFVIIHIRYGDKFLLKNLENTDLEHIKIIDKSIQLLDPNQKVLLISDNSIIKDIIVKKYPFIKTHFNEITHTGEGVEIDSDRLKNTMLDFYLFSFAEKILAFSVYCHGTGFSKWAAETYSVPYVCRFLP